MKIKIESGIPIPTLESKRIKYPFREMKVGESFFVKDIENPKKTRNRIASAATMWARNKDYKFRTQVFDTGVRIWRIK
jgi:hypothetical protein